MRNEEQWEPTLYVQEVQTGRYVANPAHVSVLSRYVTSAAIESHISLIRRHARGSLLDCGCGQVPYYGIYRPLVDEVICVDWESSEHPLQHIDQFVDLNEPLPIADASFDTVLLSDVLEHVAEPWLLMSELARVLRPDGKLIVIVPFFYRLHETPHDYYRYTEHALRRLCEANGLRLIELEPYGGYPDILLDLLNKWLVRGERSAKVFVRSTDALRRRQRFERWRERTQKAFPLGYCLAAQK